MPDKMETSILVKRPQPALILSTNCWIVFYRYNRTLLDETSFYKRQSSLSQSHLGCNPRKGHLGIRLFDAFCKSIGPKHVLRIVEEQTVLQIVDSTAKQLRQWLHL